MTTATRRPRRHAGAIILALILILAAWVVLASGLLVPAPSEDPVALQRTPSASAVASAPPASPSTVPSSTVVPGNGTVATRITIPRLKIDLPIYQGNGYTAKLGMVAHYPTTSWPGGGSLTYLYSHARDDNFIALWDAKVGDRVELKLKDGSTVTYEVSRVDADVTWNDLSLLDPTPTELLRLQTCNSYEETAPRFVVEAVPVVSNGA